VIASGFLGQPELASLYRNALALVQPSIEEGFGLPAAEAMASGTAVITSNAPALVEVTGDAALHADAKSAEAIAAAMLRIISDSAERESLARSGIARARAFTWTRLAEVTRDAYRAAAS
jgi:glycosyltransferase involved in cell wall biosynthesis